MARALKPQKVETWKHEKRGVKLDLFLDRNDHTFFCEFQKEIVREPSLAALHHTIRRTIESSCALKWLPMVTVTRLKPFAQDGDQFIGFTIERSWIAQKADGNWLQCSWEHNDTDEDREMWASSFWLGHGVHGSTFTLPYYGAKNVFHRDYDHFYLPYTEELWVGLDELLEKLRFLRGKLDELLTTQAGLERIAGFGGNLLPATFGTPGLPSTVESESWDSERETHR